MIMAAVNPNSKVSTGVEIGRGVVQKLKKTVERIRRVMSREGVTDPS